MRLFRAVFLLIPLPLVYLVPNAASGSEARGCPADMVRVRTFCVDRFEIATVDDRSGELLSPYYPPHPRLLETVHQAWMLERSRVGEEPARELPLPELPAIQQGHSKYSARAVSRAGVVPQGYLSYPLAKQACERAGKRLCSDLEWVTACRGRAGHKFPYGEQFEPGRCNVYRHIHPASVLHGSASYGHRDPRLNLVTEPAEGPLLRLTGATPTCASSWGDDRIFDMVGNLDEWVTTETGAGIFLGGFYARSTREGCEAKISSHAPPYYDYSTGTRCCQSISRQ